MIKWLGMGIAFGAGMAALLFLMFALLSTLPLDPIVGTPHHHRQPKYRSR